MNEYFYYIHEGLAEVIIESQDFLYFDYKHVRTFINSTQEIKEVEKKFEGNRLQSELNKPEIHKMPNTVREVLSST
jgi:hypothetical protein